MKIIPALLFTSALAGKNPKTIQIQKSHLDDGLMDKKERLDFDQMSESDKKSHLLKIFKKVDSDQDGFLNAPELINWAKKASDLYIKKEVEESFPMYDEDDDGYVTWKEFEKSLQHVTEQDMSGHRSMDKQTYIEKEKMTFHHADRNNDGKLDETEMGYALHPEDFDYMKGAVVKAKLLEVDLNKDGKVDQAEYNNFVEHSFSTEFFDIEADGLSMDDFLSEKREELEMFNTRDSNKDGTLDVDEVKEWLMPGYDVHVGEAEWVLDEADKDSDGMLSESEVEEHYHILLDSSVTSFGQMLEYHDEL